MNYVIDKPDERDIHYGELFPVGNEVSQSLPSSYIIDRINDYQNQGLETITRNMCVFYSAGHGSNIMNHYEGSDVFIEGKEFGLLALDKGLLDVNAGALIQSGPSLLRDEGYINGWAKVNTIDEIRHSIFSHRPIAVGSNEIVWSRTKLEPYIAVGDSGGGHAFLIIGYDDENEVLICKNSYGKEKYDEGRFYVRYDDLHLLFPSKYSLLDSADPILEHKKQIMENINIEKAKEAFELGLWNGKNATESASREEVATMVLRAVEKLRDGQI